VLLLAGCAKGSPVPESRSSRPFFDLRSREPNYAGPGREETAPPDVKEVLIGYFGPPDDSGLEQTSGAHPQSAIRHPQFRDMWRAACLAVEQANEAGGYRSLPFRLLPAWSDNPWGSGVKDLTRLVFVDKVWAVIGGVDGPSTHLAEQVVTKAGLTLLNPVSTDKTVNLINVPWVFSCTPQDHIQAKALGEGLASRLGKNPFVLASAVDHDSHLFTVELEKALTAGRNAKSCIPVCAYHYEFNLVEGEWKDLVEKIRFSQINAVVLVARAQPSARLVRSLRDSGYRGSIFGGPSMAERAFAGGAGSAAEGIIFPCSYVPSARSAAFEERFKQRFGTNPDCLAAHTYDAVNLLVAAIRRGGLNRARIRDAVRELGSPISPWEGVSGTIAWDAPGANHAPVQLCTIRNGQVAPFAPKDDNPVTSVAETLRREGSISEPPGKDLINE